MVIISLCVCDWHFVNSNHNHRYRDIFSTCINIQPVHVLFLNFIWQKREKNAFEAWRGNRVATCMCYVSSGCILFVQPDASNDMLHTGFAVTCFSHALIRSACAVDVLGLCCPDFVFFFKKDWVFWICLNIIFKLQLFSLLMATSIVGSFCTFFYKAGSWASTIQSVFIAASAFLVHLCFRKLYIFVFNLERFYFFSYFIIFKSSKSEDLIQYIQS